MTKKKLKVLKRSVEEKFSNSADEKWQIKKHVDKEGRRHKKCTTAKMSSKVSTEGSVYHERSSKIINYLIKQLHTIAKVHITTS